MIHGIEEAGFLAAVLSRIFKTYCIFEKHSDHRSYKNKSILKNLLLTIYAGIEKLSVKLADAVICTGPGLEQQVQLMQTGTKAYNINDIPSSLNEPSFQNTEKIRNKLLHNATEVIITYVGSFAIYQGVDLLFSAIPPTVTQAPNARFIIIGGNDTEIAERKNELRLNNVIHNVTFLGKIPPDILPDYLAASDILLSPRGSGVNTPLKVLDYMKAGGAIIASDHPSNKLLLDDNTAVFAQAEARAFSDAIVSLIQDPDRRRSLGENCRHLYKKKLHLFSPLFQNPTML